MITLNGKKFAATDREFTASLFEQGGTCAGFYRVKRNRIEIRNMARDLVGVISERGLLCAATKHPDGRFRYSFATIKEVGKYQSFSQSIDEPRAIHRQLCAVTLPG